MASMLMASPVFFPFPETRHLDWEETVTDGRTIRNPGIITAYKFGWLQASTANV